MRSKRLWSCWWNTIIFALAAAGTAVCLPALRTWSTAMIAAVCLGINIWASNNMRRVYSKWQ